MKTQKSALAFARTQVSTLAPFGGQYKFMTFSPRHDAWVESQPANHGRAQAMRSQALMDAAYRYLGNSYAPQYQGGPWASYVKS